MTVITLTVILHHPSSPFTKFLCPRRCDSPSTKQTEKTSNKTKNQGPQNRGVVFKFKIVLIDPKIHSVAHIIYMEVALKRPH